MPSTPLHSPPRPGATSRSTTALRSSSAPPIYFPARGAKPSPPQQCSASRRPHTSRDRRALRTDRLLAFQRRVRTSDTHRPTRFRSGSVESRRISSTRRFRLRDHSLQFQRHRRKSPHSTGPDGQHRDLEAVTNAGRRGVPDNATTRSCRPPARGDQSCSRRRPLGVRGRACRPPTGGYPLHRIHRNVPAFVA